MDQKTEAQCHTTQLIEGDGTFNTYGLYNFIKQIKLEKHGVSYAIVAIMGPQSSGKSTLLNHLFHTNFVEMDAKKGRTQTTNGIWISRSPGIEPCTIVMDIEGCDGQERGENDTSFEKQSALFAVAVSHIVIINMWGHDIGREHAANKPLLRTVFKVMLELFSPRKTTLMFVIRDIPTKTPFNILERDLTKEIEKTWDSIPKPEAHKDSQLREVFKVIVVGLSHYELQGDQFKAEVASLRQRFFNSIAHGGLAGDRKGVVPASGFLVSAQEIWNAIMENNQLNLPSHTLMVATVLCEKIAKEKYSSFVENEDWLKLEEDVKSHLVLGFNKNLSSLLDNCLSKYDEEALYFDVNVRDEKKEQLKVKLTQHVQPTYKRMFKHIRSKALDDFKRALDDALNKGQQLDGATDECIKMATGRFNELCEDVTGKQAHWGSSGGQIQKSGGQHSKAWGVGLPNPAKYIVGLPNPAKYITKKIFGSRGPVDSVKSPVYEQVKGDLDETRDELYRDMNLHINKVVADKERKIAEKNHQDTVRELEKQHKIAEEIRQNTERRVKELEEQRKILEETSRLDTQKREEDLAKQRKIIEESRQDVDRKLEERKKQHALKEEQSRQETEKRVKLEKEIMVALLFETYSSFIENKDWLELEEGVYSHLVVQGFGKKLSSLFDHCLSTYDEKVLCFDADVGIVKRKLLEEKLVQLVQPAYKQMFENIRSEALDNFKRAFDDALNEGWRSAAAAQYFTDKSLRQFDELCEDATCKQANWDSTKIREKFFHDMDSHIHRDTYRAAIPYELAKPYQFSLQEILSATAEFAEANVIGKGGYGLVYQGHSEQHGKLAIKRLNRLRGQGDHEYGMEITLLSKHKHENLVSLVGSCGENGERILVYKYEANQSLDKFLHSKDLSWMRRLQICMGAARGLRFLHNETGPGYAIIHRDIKSSNILLDENWNAKISDFGLCKIVLTNSPNSVTFTAPCGTFGYADPQILSGVTPKADVYSFGIVLFEVLFGKLVEDPRYLYKGSRFRVIVARKHYEEQTLHMMIDPDLRNEMTSDSLRTFSNIAYQCLKDRIEDRPTMSTVVEALEKAFGYQELTTRESLPSSSNG